MIISLLSIDLIACSATTAMAAWLVTDRLLSRTARIACAFIACGGLVNAMGIFGMLSNVDGFFYGDVWPSEVLLDIGAAVLMTRWAIRLHRAHREPACP